jgi:hypothetical protein
VRTWFSAHVDGAIDSDERTNRCLYPFDEASPSGDERNVENTWGAFLTVRRSSP